MKRIFQIIESNKVLFKNFTSLSLLQIANYIFPLITLPYLVRVLGPEKYGLINFAAAFTAYFTIITDYGFNLSATQEISVNRNNTKRMTEIFSAVFTLKMIFFILSSLIFFVVVSLVPPFREHLLLFFVTYLGVLGTALFPLWFFQGIENMKYISAISVAVRFMTTIMIFIFINSEKDFIKLAGLNTLSQFLIGIIGLSIALGKFRVQYKIPDLVLLRQQLRKGWNLFLSTVSINLYTSSNIFILGLLTNETTVGYYSAADKIRIAVQSILSPISQSIFPYVNNLLKNSYEKFITFNKMLLRTQTLVFLFLSIILSFASNFLVDIILGEGFSRSHPVLMILAWIPFLVSISNVYGIQTMLPLGHNKSFTIIVSIAAFVNILIALILVPLFAEIGTAIAFIITEFLVSLLMFLYCNRKGIKII